MKLEVGKTYKHATADDRYLITDRFSNFFVGVHANGDSTWIFDENGKALGIRGSHNTPYFSIVEIPVDEVVYVRLNNWGDLSVSDKSHLGTAVTDIKVTFKDGIAVSAELHKPNEEKTSKKRILQLP